jgi:DNA end-binding protein Ku
MAVRSAWKGYLKLSLVTCAVELYNATTYTEKVSFHVVNRKTGNRVKRQFVDAETGKPVEDEDQVKGYELGDDEYLLLDEDEIESVEIESKHTLDLEGFVDRSEIDPVYLDTPYYLAPADEVSEEAFAVIRDALARKKMAGLARIVLYRRERPVLIEPRDKGMLMTTLRFAKLVRADDELFDDIKNVKVDQEMIDLASSIIAKKKARFDPSKFEDKYEDALLELIKAKKAGKKPPIARPAERPSNVINLFDALKKSLGEEGGKAASRGGAKRKPARSRSTAARKKQGKTQHRKSA